MPPAVSFIRTCLPFCWNSKTSTTDKSRKVTRRAPKKKTNCRTHYYYSTSVGNSNIKTHMIKAIRKKTLVAAIRSEFPNLRNDAIGQKVRLDPSIKGRRLSAALCMIVCGVWGRSKQSNHMKTIRPSVVRASPARQEPTPAQPTLKHPTKTTH